MGGRRDPALIEPGCEGSTLRLGGAVLFSNPATVRRELMGVRSSLDGGRTWPAFSWLYPGPSAYSDLAALDDASAGILYERGRLSPYEAITFSPLDPAWLAAGAGAPGR